MRNLILGTAAVLLTPTITLAQAPPVTAQPVAPKTEQLDPKACAPSGTRSTVGQGGDIEVTKPAGRNLSDQLARSDGVICPPGQVDPEIHAPTPSGGAAMPVIPPPGSPGGDPSVKPK
ncbi:MAG: hypothetical protein Q7T81_05360 [Pseudolabrys sp.]|nr:hypothetical protein [Pseudolabrys sp.]